VPNSKPIQINRTVGPVARLKIDLRPAVEMQKTDMLAVFNSGFQKNLFKNPTNNTAPFEFRNLPVWRY
jgi:hypothetical protein